MAAAGFNIRVKMWGKYGKDVDYVTLFTILLKSGRQS